MTNASAPYTLTNTSSAREQAASEPRRACSAMVLGTAPADRHAATSADSRSGTESATMPAPAWT